MNGYTQIRDGKAESPSLDPQWFDPARGPVVPCRVKVRNPIGLDEQCGDTVAILEFAAGERERCETAR